MTCRMTTIVASLRQRLQHWTALCGGDPTEAAHDSDDGGHHCARCGRGWLEQWPHELNPFTGLCDECEFTELCDECEEVEF